MKYLGIDYGKRKVGLAISEGISVSPLKVIEISSLVDAVQKVRQVIQAEQIDEVVVGMAESGESKSMTEKFVKELEKKIKVVVVEETLSSQQADKQMRELGVVRGKRGKNDAMAAAIILEGYLSNATI
jgi:putative transcription antitermination factor YqgF